MVIGGVAVIAHGVHRTTRDLDLAFAGDALESAVLLDELEAAGFEPRIADALAFAAESQVLLVRHRETGIEVDVSRAWLELEREALAAARDTRIGGVDVPVALPEDLVIFKALAGRPTDLADVRELLALHAKTIDLERVRRWVRSLGKLMEVDRIAELETLIARTPKP